MKIPAYILAYASESVHNIDSTVNYYQETVFIPVACFANGTENDTQFCFHPRQNFDLPMILSQSAVSRLMER